MSGSFDSYAAARSQLLERLTVVLEDDHRVVAAWLAGSFGRRESDGLSDLDLYIVVDDAHAAALCRRKAMVAGGTTQERLELIRQVGNPVIVHENHHNAPAGGTFTAVIYGDSAQQVDWTLVPHSVACKPSESAPLFERISIPACPVPTTLDENDRREQFAERLAFFWMMAVPTTKYALRGDAVHFHILFDMLDRTARDVERLIEKEAWTYQRGSRVTLQASQQDQLDAVRLVCHRVAALEAAHGTAFSSSRMDAVNLLLSLDRT